MKKLLMLLLLSICFFSCKKEENKPSDYTFIIECESCTIQINDKYYTLHDYMVIQTNSKLYVKLTTTKTDLIPFKLSINNRYYSGKISEYVSFELKDLN